ncbi:MAG: hypothetical protein ACR2QG_00725 [Gammaproteobacteria bacterium]
MNRKNLTAAVLAGLAGAAGIAGTAQAVNLNPDGLGQVLIYPYYTVNGGNLTALSVVNTSEDAKAVKVRFLEGQNSLEVLDFNLYLSAWDVWTAAIVDAGGTPTLVIEDRTCTVPDLVRDFGGSQAFLTYGLGDGGSEDISRTREGHFEMIEMGTLVGSSASAATHVAGEPAGCDTLVDAWTLGPDGDFGTDDDGYWIDVEGGDLGPLIDIEDPTGGLFGGASIVNPTNGTMYSYDARAINGFDNWAAGVDGTEVLHSYPGNEAPSLNSGDQLDGYVFTDNGESVGAGFNMGVDAVSYVFMHDSIMNEYVTGGSLKGSSEWVVTFPTKNFYVNNGEVTAPFVSEWSDNFGEDGVNDGACEPVFLDTIWDQEEQFPTSTPGPDTPPIVSPAPEDPNPDPSTPFELCFETNVLRFGAADEAGDTTEILGSSNFTNVDGGYAAGWARIDLLEYPYDESGNGVFDSTRFRDYLGYDTGFVEGARQYGLPVTGFWVFESENNFLGDGAATVANYGGIWNHKATRCFAGSECRDDRRDVE